MLIARVQQAFAGLHYRTMNSEEICKQRTQYCRNQNTQSRAGYRRQKSPIPTVYQHQDHSRQDKYQRQGDPDGVQPPQEAGNQNFPHKQDRIQEGHDCPQPGTSGKQQQKQQEKPCQDCFFVQTVVIRHENRRNAIPAVADYNESLIAGGKQFILCEASIKTVYRFSFRTRETAAQDPHPAALVSGANQACIIYIGLIG